MHVCCCTAGVMEELKNREAGFLPTGFSACSWAVRFGLPKSLGENGLFKSKTHLFLQQTSKAGLTEKS